ncbi:MAG: hypothetical protein AAGH64_08985 [Planctomycetota bacterium]
MPRLSTTLRSVPFRSLTLALMVGCCGVMIGCDQSDLEAGATISEAAQTIATVSATAPAEERAGAFGRVSGELRDLSSNETAKDAASLLTAQSTAGSAQVKLEQAQGLGAQALSAVSDLRLELQEFVSIATKRDAFAAQDFTETFSRLDAEASDLSDRLDAERSKRSGIESEIARLGDEREQRVMAARELRVESVQLKRSVQDATATRRQPVLEEALRIASRADALDSEAARRQIDIDDAATRLASVVSEIETLQRQRQNNTDARAKSRELERSIRQQRDALDAQAAERARTILQEFELLMGDFESGALASYDEAARGFSRAAGEASRAASGVQSARVSAANIRLLEASALVHRAALQRALASFGSDLVAVVPGASPLAERVDALRSSANDALSQAADTYESASAALDNASERASEIRAMIEGGDEG